ncbi:ArsR/SmtB family transcription factor [Facilibium subflavum]|uniref:ArsR/SmtB family transcription factor n=1 Tax=Facilibium subflavum TaxID=2219058 RepID=UPI001F270520|nr:metalloregulator ArsR/SmtB family transcription factor [Facilibium subflavum]
MNRKMQSHELTLDTIASVCHLMGEKNRLRILFLCLEKPMSVSELVEKINISQPLVSHHLKLLRQAKLLQTKRQGKQVFYALFDTHIRCILSDMYQHWSDNEHLESHEEA